jgi:sigma-B regulation protein RsbU (phosphoserine phosphatase)
MPSETAGPGRDALQRIARSISSRQSARRSLDIAASRQRRMLPKAMPSVPGYEFSVVYRPAEHVSGDFYDIIDLGAGRHGLLVGDVSGHGPEAGIVMGAARKALQIYARSGEAPDLVMRWANIDLGPELDRETFLTAAYSILDTTAHTLHYVRAGHPPPLLMGPDPDEWQELRSGGTMIGVAGDQRFAQTLEPRQVSLQAGQTLIQYTDGLTEARERGGEEFGVDRVMEHLEALSPRAGSLDTLLAGLLAAADSWTGGAPQEDDISILAVRRRA